MKRTLIVAALVTLVMPGSDAVAQSAIDVVLAAAAAEEAATFKHGELHYTVGDKTFVYEIRRQLPDRVHVRVESEGQTQETIAIGTTTYFRTPSGWQTMTLVALPSGPISLADLLGKRFHNVHEAAAATDGGLAHRRFVGDIDWSPASGFHNRGTLSVLVGEADQRLYGLQFEGQCSDNPCEFQYVIDYDEVPVEAPL